MSFRFEDRVLTSLPTLAEKRMEHVGLSFPAYHALGRRGCPPGKKGRPASGCNRNSLKITILLCVMALPTNLPCLEPSGETLGYTCPKRSTGKNLGQKTLCQALAFSHVEELGLLEESLSGCPLSAMAAGLPVPRAGGKLALLSLGVPSGAE